jgi:SGNH domain (fused to AT3 domains)
MRRRVLFSSGLLLASLAVLVSPLAAATSTPGTPTQVASAVRASVTTKVASPAVLAALTSPTPDTAEVFFGTRLPYTCKTATDCVFGQTSHPQHVIVLFGNSHARMWLPPLDRVATAHHVALVFLGQDSCPIVAAPGVAITPPCIGLRDANLAAIASLHPALVLVADRATNQPVTPSVWQRAFADTLHTLRASTNRVVVVQDTQAFSFSPLACLGRFPTAMTRCQMHNPNPLMSSVIGAEQAASSQQGAAYLKTNQWLCATTTCAPVIANSLAYWDPSHVSATYALYLTTVWDAALTPFLNALGPS